VLAAPAFLPGVLGLAPTAFAWLFVPAVAGTMSGAFLSSRLAGRLSPVRTIVAGYALMTLSVLGNVAQALLMEPPRVPWATLPLFPYNVGMGLAMAPLQVMLLDTFPERRGMAASGMAFTLSAGNALVAGVVSPLLWHSAGAMAGGALACVAGAMALFAWHVRSPSFRPLPTPP
jgi:DHA1 family bicyclomycin/chloramphenicol resistance-like MFS transporter